MAGTTAGSRGGPSAVGRWRRQFDELVRYVPDGTTIPEERWAARHKGVIVSLLAHVPFLLVLGLYEGTESAVTGATLPSIPTPLVLGQVGIVVAIALLANWSRFGRRARTAIGSFGLMTTSTLMVQFSGGYIEAHFHFFVVMAVVALYEDWLPFLIGLGYVATGHVVFSLINPANVYNHPAAIEYPFAWAGIHAAFILALSAALMTNWYSIERSREESEARLEQVEERTEQIQEVEEAKAEAERQREAVEEMAETLERKATEYGTVMARCADGDLTQRMGTESDNESMREIATTFNAMMDDIEGTVVDIQTFADVVADESERAATSATEVREASEQVSESTQEIVVGAERQNEDLLAVADETGSLSASVEEVAAAANQVATAAEAAAARGEDAQQHAREAIEDMNAVERRTVQTVEEVESLDEEMKRIGDIVELIDGIAEQTNLLALNASIEAARAGEAGEGFAVVADEIKGLATEAGRATDDIEGIIDGIVASTEEAVDDMQATGESVTEGVDTVESALEALDDVVEGFEETNQGVQEIDDATADQASSTEEVVGMVEEVASVSEQTTAEASNVSAAAEEQTASVNEVAESVQSLSDRADRLHSLLERFEVDGAAGATDVTAAGRSISTGSGDSAVENVVNPPGPASTDGGTDRRN
ncbi:methyl-accepting chemotaxis protein [Halobium salinum]|uniref:Methyl-accepting chemotaxis protein n=1 Tax=Halobium salinum TaxID=1364940 RepID=A0ABD5PGY8_9EURY|nr:methyl-accepting chemotaxis protein [Halobium salinum]